MENKLIIYISLLFVLTSLLICPGININSNIAGEVINNSYYSINQKISCNSFEEWNQTDKLTASDFSANDKFGDDVDIHGDYAIIGAQNENHNNKPGIGAAYIYKREGKNWFQQAKLVASDGKMNDHFGNAVSLSDDYAIVGAFNGDSGKLDVGTAYIFKRNGMNWSQKAKLNASDCRYNDLFGFSVSIDGDYVVIGAYRDDHSNKTDAGSAYIFKRNSTNWTEEAKLVASDCDNDDRFGVTVSISGESVIVGSYKDDDKSVNSGSAYVFKRNGSVWTEVAKLLASDGKSEDWFGYQVSIWDDHVIVGSPQDHNSNGDDAGSAYIFKRNGSVWIEEAKLLASDGQADDIFGIGVSIYKNLVIIGAPGEDELGSVAGAAYIFEKVNDTWYEVQKIIASDGAPHDYFGWSVSIYGSYAIGGAGFHDHNNKTDAGAAYMFKKLFPELNCYGELNWIDVSIGSTNYGIIYIENNGELNSKLNWEIELYPEWGTWTFNPSSGLGLTPENGTFKINVSVIAPDEKNLEFIGVLKIVNSDNNSDYCIIDVSLSTPKNKPFNINAPFQRFFEQHPFLFLIFRQMVGL